MNGVLIFVDSTETTELLLFDVFRFFANCTFLEFLFFAKYLDYSSNTHNLTLCNNNNDDDDDDDENNHDNNIIVIFRLAYYITKILMFL